MGFRFRRSPKIAPGVHANISKSGVSYSFGRRGAHVTLGHGKVRSTVGIPGSGLSYTTTSGGRSKSGLLFILQYLPLIVLAAFLMHWSYDPLKRRSWDNAQIAALLCPAGIAIFILLRWLTRKIPQEWALLAGFAVCGGSVIVSKLNHHLDMEWTGTIIFALVLAAMGAWSFGSCHQVLSGRRM
jgi:hypothetical protein